MKIHVLKGFIQNIFLVEYPDKCMLLDGCSKADFSTLADFFERSLKRPLSDLKVVVVTHMHPDHAGCALFLRHKTGCKIVSCDKQTQWYSGLKGRLAHLIDIALALWVAGKMNRPKKNIWYPPHLRPDIALSDQQTIPGFEEWQVFETPGHTDRDLSVMHMPSKRIYIADLIVRVKGKLSPPFPVYKPKQYKQSLLKLQALQTRSVMMAHVGELSLTDSDFAYLLSKAPLKPKTNKLAIQKMIKSKLFKTRLQS
ncbi:Zn-dependent hydrolase [Glaciecola punicea]|uniref:MBL fold metallo-hydrolase n=1 Tax=Glaciecola punicea TaxID=56804 RepID=UPI000871C701|nr:MBL fold metallo-hydrolase [Glaciecola punicea]OFA30484.1 Zn-dependent hydrolase [Glaciecola punicea]